MALQITSLNSGSNGNCYYVANDSEAILIDTGISCKETEKRMALLGLSMKMVKAIFISHEHTDHIKGLPVIAAKYNLPVFISKGTYRNSGLSIYAGAVNWLNAGDAVYIGELCITSFLKQHDAEDPHSFVVTHNGINVGVFTDLGVCCDQLVSHFKTCHAAFLEANYDETMLENGRYPWFLKNRIRGGKGHLSNTQALEIFTKHRPPNLSHLLLAHLSKDNNDPQLVQRLFESQAQQTKIIVASRYAATGIYTITNDLHPKLVQTVSPKPVQMQLFY